MYLTQKGKLLRGFSVNCHIPQFQLKSTQFESKKLNDIVLFNPNDGFDIYSEEFFVNLSAINNEEIYNDKYEFRNIQERGRYPRCYNGDLLVTNIISSFQRGKFAVLKLPYNIRIFTTPYLIQLRPFDDSVLSEYILIMMRDKRILQNAAFFTSGSTGPIKIKTKFIENIEIPLPPVNIQNQVVNLFQNAISQKKDFQSKIKSIRSEILVHLANIVGIPVNPPVSDSIFQMTNGQKVTGKRLDVYCYDSVMNGIISHIENSPYQKVMLKDILTFIANGEHSKNWINDNPDKKMSLFGSNLNCYCEVHSKKVKYISIEYHNQILRTETKLYDVLMVLKGQSTAGRVAIITDEAHISQNINGNIVLMRFNDNVNPFFVTYLLSLPIYQTLIHRLCTGAMMYGLTKPVIKSIRIPLPPIEIQNEFANYVIKKKKLINELKEKELRIIEDTRSDIYKNLLSIEL